MGAIFLGGNYMGGNFPGSIFLVGGIFPVNNFDKKRYIVKCVAIEFRQVKCIACIIISQTITPCRVAVVKLTNAKLFC